MLTAIPCGYDVLLPDGPSIYFAHFGDAEFFCKEFNPRLGPTRASVWSRALSPVEFSALNGAAPVAPDGLAHCERLFRLGEYLIRQGHPTIARDVLRKAVEADTSPTPSSDIMFYAGRQECVVGNLQAGLRLIRRAYRLVPDGPYSYAYGSVLMALGRIDEATAVLERGARVPLDNGAFTSTLALCFDDRIGNAADVRLPDIRLDPATEALFFAAADSTYFCRYAKAVASSLAQHAPRAALHLHIVNPDDQALALADSLAGLLTFSTEVVDLAGFDEAQRKTYYACTRYRVLPALMAMHAQPIVVTDMDQIVMRDPAPLLAFAADHDVSLVRFAHQAPNLLSYFSATLAVFSPTQGAKAFADRLRGYVTQATEDRTRLLWHLDQAAIARAHFVMPEVTYWYIPLAMLHLVPTPPIDTPAIFWSITNSIPANLSKLETEAFLQYC